MSGEEIALLKQIDRIFLDRPFYGRRKITIERARAATTSAGGGCNG